MFFARQMPLSSVIALCRALRHNLGAGLTLVQVFRQQAERGPSGVRPFAQRVLVGLEQGRSLHDVLENEKHALPPLFFSMVKVGEETGHLAEIFTELEKHYLLEEKLRRQFRSQSMLPVIQLGLAFLMLAGLIYILGMIAASRNTQPMKLFGLSGASGAMLFLLYSFGTVAVLYAFYRIAGPLLREKPGFDALLLRIPGIGPCLEAFTLGRFAMGLYLTLDSGMSIVKALRLSLIATGNSAFTYQTETITLALKNGQPLIEALTLSGLFSPEFLEIIAVGEEGGRIPEVMRQQAEYYHEEAARRLTIATRLAGLLVWLIYAAFMIWAIFNVASMYLGALGV